MAASSNANGIPSNRRQIAETAAYLTDAAREIDEGHYPGDLANVTMMGATADHIVDASTDAGIDVGLPNAVKAQYDRAIAAGHGADNWTSLFEAIKKPSA